MKTRNENIDIIRGFAILLVVLGHTMSGCLTSYSDSMLYQAIWTIQMPLFFIISGYITRYSKKITNKKLLISFIGKRTIAYMMPWLVWTIIIRGILLNESIYLDIPYILFHMDSGYWFLATIWTMSLVFGISDYLSHKLANRLFANIVMHILFFVLGIAGLILIGYSYSMDAFAIKFTIYYMPMFLLGYLYGQFQERLHALPQVNKIIDSIVAISFILWILSISKFNFFIASDNIQFALFRFLVSLLGCVTIIGLFSSRQILTSSSKMLTFLGWVGKHSLEIYLTHYLFLVKLPVMETPLLFSMDGFLTLSINYLLSVSLTIIIIRIISCNNILNYLLYSKRK